MGAGTQDTLPLTIEYLAAQRTKRAKNISSVIDFRINDHVDVTTFISASLLSNFIVKSCFNPFQRIKTILQCQKEAFPDHEKRISFRHVIKSNLRSSSDRARPARTLSRKFFKFCTSIFKLCSRLLRSQIWILGRFSKYSKT